MKQRLHAKMNLQFRFFILCLLEFVAVAVLAEIGGWMLRRWLGVTPEIPAFVWAILFSVVLGSAIARYASHTFFAPITRLCRAMKEVAGGDFHIEMQTDSKIDELRELYDNFNCMVRELNSTETLQTDFISSVSHEFKTPINAIEGYAALLQEQDLTPDEQRQYVEKILFNTRRLSTLTGNILLLSKLSSQSIRPRRTTFRLDEQIRQAVLALEQKWEDKELELDVDLERTAFTGYEALLLHVWTNLIDNAVDALTDAGTKDPLIRVTLGETPRAYVFSVSNNGPAIPDEIRESIFHLGFTTKSAGHGSGLSIVSEILESYSGEITVESTPDHTSFSGTIPKAARKEAAENLNP